MRKATQRQMPLILKASAATLAITVAMAPAAALAAETQAADEAQSTGEAQENDDIVVTATKRSETILEIPSSISAVTAEALEQKGVKDLEDLAKSVPSLSIAPTFDDGAKVFILRGIAPTEGSDATVAVYLDDTPITVGANSPDLKIFDIDRIEVARGPQGTLFGSSAMGGAIRYISPQIKYNGEITGRAKVELGSVAHGGLNYEAQGAIGAPIADNIAVRASAFYRRDAGYIDVVDEFTGEVTNNNANSTDTYGGRVAVGAKLTDDVEATLSVLYQNRHQHGISSFHTVLGMTDLSIDPTAVLDSLQSSERVNADGKDKFLLPNLLIQADLGFADLTSSSSYHRQRIRLTNDYSYFTQRLIENALPAPLGTFNGLVVPSNRDHDVDSYIQEVRLASKAGDSKLDWLIGAYYKDSKLDTHQENPTNLVDDFGFPAFLLLPGDGGLLTNDVVVKTNEAAVFGELSYNVTDKLKITAGLRYSSLKQNVAADTVYAPLLGIPSASNEGTSKDHPLTPKISISYDVTDDAMVYATASKGFRLGGPNLGDILPGSQCETDLATIGYSEVPSGFDSDSLWNYEAGLKLRTEDRRVQFQGAVYHIDWSNIQQIIGLPCGFAFTDNVGKAKVYGAEAEIVWRPIDALRFDINAGYVDAKLTENSLGESVSVRIPQVPKFTASVAGQYEFPITGNLDGYVRAELNHIGKAVRVLDLAGVEPQGLRRDGYQIVNLRAAVSTGDYEFSLFADNVTDERPAITDIFNDKAPGAFGFAESRTTIRPRTIGISASLRY